MIEAAGRSTREIDEDTQGERKKSADPLGAGVATSEIR